jgi:hypothetical protein
MSKKSTKLATAVLSTVFANNIVSTLDALSVARQSWEATSYKTANEGLYDLLSQCLDVYQDKFVKANDSDRKALRVELSAKLKASNVRVQVNSPTLNLFVRFVFSSDRKRAHGYAYVLSAAISDEIKAADLAAWIVGAGGIEEIKRKMVKSEEAIARQEKSVEAKLAAEASIEEAKSVPLATVSIEGFMPSVRNILLTVGNVNGDFNVTYVLTDVSDSLYSALLKQAAKQIVNAQVRDDNVSNEIALEAEKAANANRLKKAA